MRCLIVGGHHDGEWVDDVQGEFMQKPVRTMACVTFPFDPNVPEISPIKIATYKRRIWRSGETQRWTIWAPPEMRDIDVMNRLLEGYRRHTITEDTP
jgi:hypothetical protein